MRIDGHLDTVIDLQKLGNPKSMEKYKKDSVFGFLEESILVNGGFAGETDAESSGIYSDPFKAQFKRWAQVLSQVAALGEKIQLGGFTGLVYKAVRAYNNTIGGMSGVEKTALEDMARVISLEILINGPREKNAKELLSKAHSALFSKKQQLGLITECISMLIEENCRMQSSWVFDWIVERFSPNEVKGVYEQAIESAQDKANKSPDARRQGALSGNFFEAVRAQLEKAHLGEAMQTASNAKKRVSTKSQEPGTGSLRLFHLAQSAGVGVGSVETNKGLSSGPSLYDLAVASGVGIKKSPLTEQRRIESLARLGELGQSIESKTGVPRRESLRQSLIGLEGELPEEHLSVLSKPKGQRL